ncbi:hypothetical protein C0993_005584 [Termitomyces sp. T159_Od127]|nr:hypothetical protein C0993_005584 [Termitomyces sp. T159_Od127]
MQPLSKPIPVFNINGTSNEASAISSIVDLVLQYQTHTKHTVFALGMPLPAPALSQTGEVAVEMDLVKVAGVAE